MRFLLRTAVSICAALICALAQAQDHEKVALVIGNADYETLRDLTNPARDAAAVADALRDLGFDVTVQTNASHNAMRLAFRDFADAARAADIAVIYYAGHGVELGGTNYLTPIEARLRDISDVDYSPFTLFWA